ncbi:MAG: enoyl-CoA hydratase-related protein [Ilumatobacteraceae bacterium]
MAGDGGSSDVGAIGRVAEGQITHLGQQACWVWQEIPVPVIAAVHGHALGGGLQIALAADIRIAHPDTTLSVRELHWGLTPDMTATLTLTRLVRPDVAKELTFSARLVDGTEAASLGPRHEVERDPTRRRAGHGVRVGHSAARTPCAARRRCSVASSTSTPPSSSPPSARRSKVSSEVRTRWKLSWPASSPARRSSATDAIRRLPGSVQDRTPRAQPGRGPHDHAALARETLWWGALPHRELADLFAAVATDSDNRVVIVTGTGDEFITLPDGGVGALAAGGVTATEWDTIIREGNRTRGRTFSTSRCR